MIREADYLNYSVALIQALLNLNKLDFPIAREQVWLFTCIIFFVLSGHGGI